MDRPTIQQRSFEFARKIIRAVRAPDEDRVGRVLAGQLLRSGTSIGANVEEAQAGQSKADFAAKLSIARKEARETLYWLRLFQAEGIMPSDIAADLVRERDGIVATLTAIVKTSQRRE